MTPLIEISLFLLILTIIIVLIVITIYLVKLIQEATLTMSNVKEITDTTKKELEPALKSINKVLTTVNNVSTITNNQIELIKKILTIILGASYFAFNKMKIGNGLISGILSGLKIFSKKRR